MTCYHGHGCVKRFAGVSFIIMVTFSSIDFNPGDALYPDML